MLDFGCDSEEYIGIDVPPGIEIPVYWERDGITHNAKRARRMDSGKIVLWARCGALVHRPERVTEATQAVSCIACLAAL
jgi:hypothetical protein